MESRNLKLEKMRRKITCSILLLLFAANAFAQQTPLFNHVFFNKVHQNPAFAGLQDEICVNIMNRQQWVGLEGAPQSTVITANTPISLFGTNSGVGISVLDDRIGFEKTFGAKLDYSYIHSLRAGRLSIGLKLGMFNKSFEGTWKTPDGTIFPNDPVLPQEKAQDLVFDMGFGAVYMLNNFYFGVSALHLTEPKFKFSNENNVSYLRRHYFITTGYKLDIASSPIELSPNLLVQFDEASPQFVLSINATYNKKFWGGVTYRTMSELEANLGIELFNGIKIGYSYGTSLSKMISTNEGSHEVMIGYCFNLEFGGIPQKYRSVRFL